jgi:hypothetical protein
MLRLGTRRVIFCLSSRCIPFFPVAFHNNPVRFTSAFAQSEQALATRPSVRTSAKKPPPPPSLGDSFFIYWTSSKFPQEDVIRPILVGYGKI